LKRLRVVQGYCDQLLFLKLDHLLAHLRLQGLHLHHQLQVAVLRLLKLLLEFPLFDFRIQQRLTQHISVVAQALVLLVHSVDVQGLLLVQSSILEGLLLEVVNLSLQVLDCHVLLQFELR